LVQAVREEALATKDTIRETEGARNKANSEYVFGLANKERQDRLDADKVIDRANLNQQLT
jgi:hypothetical protein